MSGGVLIPDGSLALQRMLNEVNLSASAQIQTKSATVNANGGFTASWETVATLPCRLGTAANSLERLIAGGTQEMTKVPIIFAAGVQISNTARLLVTWDDAGVSRSLTFSIIGREDIRTRAQSARYICEVMR